MYLLHQWIWHDEHVGAKAVADADLTRPALVCIGDGCDISKSNKGRSIADYSTALLRDVFARPRNRQLPLRFILVDEAYTLQCCPVPTCLRPPQSNWRSQQGALAAMTVDTLSGREDWIRSR